MYSVRLALPKKTDEITTSTKLMENLMDELSLSMMQKSILTLIL